jgi:hypothetical protein
MNELVKYYVGNQSVTSFVIKGREGSVAISIHTSGNAYRQQIALPEGCYPLSASSPDKKCVTFAHVQGGLLAIISLRSDHGAYEGSQLMVLRWDYKRRPLFRLLKSKWIESPGNWRFNANHQTLTIWEPIIEIGTESHYSPHRYRICSFEFPQILDDWRQTTSSISRRKYPTTAGTLLIRCPK